MALIDQERDESEVLQAEDDAILAAQKEPERDVALDRLTEILGRDRSAASTSLLQTEEA
mgnify:CR=1 FL=1